MSNDFEDFSSPAFNTMPHPYHSSLAARYGAVMMAFVALGSLLLLTWLHYQQQQEAQRVFLTVAQNDVDFVRRLNLPRSAKLAEDLQQLLRQDIHFRNSNGLIEPPLNDPEKTTLEKIPATNEVIHLTTGRQALVLDLDEEHEMIFIQTARGPTMSLERPGTLYALLTFWLFSALFTWVIGQQVVGPIRQLTHRLTDFFTPETSDLPEVKRQDEIGEMARALTQARNDLNEERLRREQSERLAILGRVATGLAHEIKNPLASIQLHAQLMESVDLDAESQTSLRHLLAEVRVIEGLVNQWLYLARPASPKKQTLELYTILKETVLLLSPQAEHAGVEIKLEAQMPSATVAEKIQGDRLRLQQVFRNLILNGIQAMPAGGGLDIQLEIMEGQQRLTFRDHGSGFTSKALQEGADLFFSEKEGGMGIGLNVAPEIISAHNGQITLQNHPDGGAIVQITLPMNQS